MKKIFFLAAAIIMILPVTKGQSFKDTAYHDKNVKHELQHDGSGKHGIYKTQDDFVRNNIAELSVTDDHDKLLLDMDNQVVLISQGKRTGYRYGSLGGYYNEGHRYRAYGDKKVFGVYGYYKILNDNGLILYSKTSVNHKSGSHTWYYYSKDAVSPIRKLTAKNLKQDFTASPVFVKAATKSIHDDTFLLDKEGVPYLNYLYKTTDIR